MITYPFSLIVSMLALAVVPLAIGADGTAEPSPTLHPYTKMVESKPVRIGDLEFVAVTEEEWWVIGCYIDLQLHIKNRGDKDVLFPTFDTFRIELKTLEGVTIPRGGGRDMSINTRPVLVPAHGSYCLCRNARFAPGTKPGTLMFTYSDGTGEWATYSPIVNGAYSLQFFLRSPVEDPQQSPAEDQKGKTGIPTWIGKGATNEVRFRVFEPD
jgi:hypothetical protein